MMTEIESAHLDISAASHPGRTGKINEDRYGVATFLTGDRGDLPAVFAILCDGIGGHRAGEIAAQMGVTIVSESIAASDGLQPLKSLQKAVQQANKAIFEASLSQQGRRGMGTTCACAWVIEDRLYTANLGDSRIYLLRGGHILQLTTDHTWLQEAYDAGILNEAQGGTHPNAHVIHRYLGAARAPRPDFRLWFFDGEGDADALENQGLRLEPGDLLLLCSDGLTDLVSDDEIRNLMKTTSLEHGPAALIDLANARGGHDNVTVVLLRVPGGPDRTVKPVRKPHLIVGCLVALIVIGILAAAVYAGLCWQRQHTDANREPMPAVTQPLFTQLPEMFSVSGSATPVIEISGTPKAEQAPTLTPWPTHTPPSK